MNSWFPVVAVICIFVIPAIIIIILEVIHHIRFKKLLKKNSVLPAFRGSYGGLKFRKEKRR